MPKSAVRRRLETEVFNVLVQYDDVADRFNDEALLSIASHLLDRLTELADTPQQEVADLAPDLLWGAGYMFRTCLAVESAVTALENGQHIDWSVIQLNARIALTAAGYAPKGVPTKEGRP